MSQRLAVCFVTLVLVGPAPAQRAAYTPEQLSLIRAVSESELSPDGETVAFVSDSTGALELWTVPAAGGWPSQLTNLGEQVGEVRYSPDGKFLVFTSDEGGNERRDLYRVPAAGGKLEKLLGSPASESEPRFAPDGKRLAFTADPDPKRAFLFQLHVLDLDSGKTTQLTREPLNVSTPVWSRDGNFLAVTRSGDDQKGEVLLVDARSGAKTEVPPPIKGGILWPQAFSPDGKALLVIMRNPEGYEQLGLVSLEPGKEGKLPRPQDPVFIGPGKHDVTNAVWNRHGIFFAVNEGGKSALYLLREPRGEPVSIELADGVAHGLSFDKEANRLALLQEAVQRPADVWVLDVAAGLRAGKSPVRCPAKQVTYSLMGGVVPGKLAAGKLEAYESFDKRKIEALVLEPPVKRLGTPPPAIVYVHGGPNSQVRYTFLPFFHVLTEAGFVVIAPNYRGSTGYGQAFQDLNNKDWGGGDLNDIEAAVKHFAKAGLIDPQRVGITGGSYGGYMTLMALSKKPDLFKVGVERYGMPDLVMDYMIAKSRFADWYETEMGNPRQDAALFRERSALPFLDDVKAPLRIFQGAGDTNV
ncbi:MAG: alpha/beta fold hydrolase, partial [Gemmataceae bacterium]